MSDEANEKKSIGIKDFIPYKENPSPITGISYKQIEKKEHEFEIHSKETGEEFYARKAGAKFKVLKDERSYVKLYRDSIYIIGTLNTPALKLFTYLSFNLEKGRDYVHVNVNAFLDQFQYAKAEGKSSNRSHYYKGVIELLQSEIIYRKYGSENTFWINVDVFFNGKREGLYNDRINSNSASPGLKPFGDTTA